jgi:hypothetical protein
MAITTSIACTRASRAINCRCNSCNRWRYMLLGRAAAWLQQDALDFSKGTEIAG